MRSVEVISTTPVAAGTLV